MRRERGERPIYRVNSEPGFTKYNPELGDDLRHKLWTLKERTGVPMTVHLRQALTVYLDVYEKVEQEQLSEAEQMMRRGELALERLDELLSG